MKPQSPAHRMIQLRRKTQKIVIPKASWDLSGKQNNNISHNYETSKSKNSSSKKNSLQKKSNMKKTTSMSQNMLKSTLKNLTKHSIAMKDSRQLVQISGQKKRNNKKSQPKSDHSLVKGKDFAESMNKLFIKARNQKQIESLKQSYIKHLHKFVPKTESQKQIFSILCDHLFLWIDKCQGLDRMINFMTKISLKIDAKNIESQQAANYSQDQKYNQPQFDSEPSMCSYIADPKQQIKLKSIREDLKQQLHLNFAKIDYLRKKQIQ